ncbi:PrsW family intramembrane metalloprotease [Candidatus Peregrinibacteria bacterium]|nr:PrsW family intramembrane metalloprotease [Candidatus Peregrinibacteria bacterium]
MTNFQLIERVLLHQPIAAFFSILLVFVPILVWMYIFNQKGKQSRKVIFITFLAGIFSAIIMFIYQYFWEMSLNFGFFELKPINFQQNFAVLTREKFSSFASVGILSIFAVSMSIGFIEEYLKHWVVKKADHNFFNSVDDIIECSIIAGLGFAFTENIIYLFRELLYGGISDKYFSLFFLRSIFVVFVHILCSGIYGYYYGIGYYAGPILQEKRMAGRDKIIPEILHRIIHLKKTRVFHDEMVALGLIISTLIHGIFDFFMSANWTLGGLLGIESLDKIGVHTIVLPLYLVIGFNYLSYLLDKKEDHKKFGHLVMNEEYVK